ncbi:response regulator transcription factor [bacterium]|nr:response regulator transcription factor [bacterium]
MPRILIVEDDESMAVALKDGFEFEGYEVTLVTDGAAGLREARERPPDLMILDVMLPRMNGHDICRELRGGGSRLPIIMLTARGQEIDKVLGLKLGADDYVTKPFGFLELTARAEALLRRAGGRAGGHGGTANASFGDVEVHFDRGEVTRGGEPVAVSARELRLLQYFVDHAGRVLSRDELLDAVWDYEHAPLTRTVDMHVAKLRKKIEADPSDPKHIVTVHRMGYKFVR